MWLTGWPKNELVSDALIFSGKRSSAVVNISSRSLKALYSRWQTALPGLNLRYYVRNKTVDRGLEETITGNGGSFWYLNNGIVIVCFPPARFDRQQPSGTLELSKRSFHE